MIHSGIPEALQRNLDTLPEGPGVYLWKDRAGQVLYVGKARNLRVRVPSYVGVDDEGSRKNTRLRERLADVDTIVVPTESQSLLLENNLIKDEERAGVDRAKRVVSSELLHDFEAYVWSGRKR